MGRLHHWRQGRRIRLASELITRAGQRATAPGALALRGPSATRLVSLGFDGVRIDQRLREHVPERLGSDVLLAAAALLSAGAGTRVVKAQVMAAAADRLGLWRRHLGRAPLLSELALGGKYPQPTAVVLLERASAHRA